MLHQIVITSTGVLVLDDADMTLNVREIQVQQGEKRMLLVAASAGAPIDPYLSCVCG